MEWRAALAGCETCNMTASTADPAGVFISYRHQDAAYAASWLHDRLVKHLGGSDI